MRSSLWLGVVLGILVAATGAEASPVPTPIAVSGWNRDVVIGDTTNYYANNFYGSTAGPYAFMENGASSDTGNATATGGFPVEAFDSTVNFNSAYTNTVTGGNTVFQFQPFDTTGTESGSPSPNILGLAHGGTNTGTLTFTTPAAYSSLAVLATVNNGASNGTGTYVITFADSSTVSGTYNAINWGTSSGPIAYTTTQLAENLGGGGSGGANPSWTLNSSSAYFFETDINLSGVLTSLGDNASTEAIDNIAFTGYSTGSAYTGIFALSGTPAPEPTSLALLGMVSVGLLARRRRR